MKKKPGLLERNKWYNLPFTLDEYISEQSKVIEDLQQRVDKLETLIDKMIKMEKGKNVH